MRFASHYVKLTEELVDLLKQTIHDRPVIDLFAPGGRVKIIQDPFAGLEAVFKNFDGNHRAFLLLNWLGSNMRIKESSFELGALKREA